MRGKPCPALPHVFCLSPTKSDEAVSAPGECSCFCRMVSGRVANWRRRCREQVRSAMETPQEEPRNQDDSPLFGGPDEPHSAQHTVYSYTPNIDPPYPTSHRIPPHLQCLFGVLFGLQWALCAKYSPFTERVTRGSLECLRGKKIGDTHRNDDIEAGIDCATSRCSQASVEPMGKQSSTISHVL